jgi:hypothetical protein
VGTAIQNSKHLLHKIRIKKPFWKTEVEASSQTPRTMRTMVIHGVAVPKKAMERRQSGTHLPKRKLETPA